jgi:predicted O-methyltransferase YrrM
MDFVIRKYVFLKICPNYNFYTRMFLFRLVKYLKYTLFSHHKKGHGIHSPFAFDLISRIFRNKIDPVIVFTVEKTRKKLIADKRNIKVHDLGSGSSKRMRRVSDIARRSPVPVKYGNLLASMAAEFGKPLILELGTSFGISTMYMAASCRDAQVITIEGCGTIADIARKNFNEAGIENIKVIDGSFDDVLPELVKAGVKPGLVFIDGNHRKEPVIRYFNQLAKFSDNKTVIIIDDINYSKEMAEAWKEIKLNEKVTVSIDIHRMGICFFREGINPNNYIIRY